MIINFLNSLNRYHNEENFYELKVFDIILELKVKILYDISKIIHFQFML